MLVLVLSLFFLNFNSSFAQMLEGSWRAVRVEYLDENEEWQTISSCTMAPSLDTWDGENWHMILDESNPGFGRFKFGNYEERITDYYESESTKLTLITSGYLSASCPITENEITYKIDYINCFEGDCLQFALQEIYSQTSVRAGFRYVFERARK